MALSKLLKIEDRMPEWFEKPKVQWIPWGYAVWQVFRTNPLVLFLIAFLPFWFYQSLYKMIEKKTRHVVALVPGEEKLPLDDALLYISENKKNMAKLRLELIEKRPSNDSNDQRLGNDSNDQGSGSDSNAEIPREWKLPDDWKVVKYNNKIYFTNLTSLAQTIACLREQDENKRKITFVENMQPLTTTWAVGKYIQEDDAMEKMLSGDYVIVTRRLKRNCFKEKVTWYHFMSVFSDRWIFTDRERGCSYEAYKGKEIVLHPFSKIRNLNDLTVHGTSHYDVNKYAIRLWEDDDLCGDIIPDIMFGEDLAKLVSYCSKPVLKRLKSFYKKKHERCGIQLRGCICSSCYGRERVGESGRVSRCLEFFPKKIPKSCGIQFRGDICCSCYGREREGEKEDEGGKERERENEGGKEREGGKEKNDSYEYRGIGAKMTPGRTYAIATLNRIAFVE